MLVTEEVIESGGFFLGGGWELQRQPTATKLGYCYPVPRGLLDNYQLIN